MQLSFFRADDIRPYAGAVRIRPKWCDRPVHAARATKGRPYSMISLAEFARQGK